MKPCSGLGLREEAVELATSGVEGALLILRALVDQRATSELDHVANKLVSAQLPQRRVFDALRLCA